MLCFVECGAMIIFLEYAIVGDWMNNFEVIRLLNLLYDKTREANIGISYSSIKQRLDN